MKRIVFLSLTPFLLFIAVAQGGVIDFSTNSGGWTFTGAGATNATPFIVGANGISFTDNTQRTGTLAPGASLAAFDGFWTANFSFFIPADATGLFGSFSGLFADDRVVLLLNNVPIGAGGIRIPPGGSLDGFMRLTASGADEPWTFDSADSAGSGNGAGIFIVGGMNTLTAVINNSGDGVTGPTRTFLSDGDGTGFRVTGQVTFTPEPATWTLLGAGLLIGGLRQLWRGASLRR
ncbi:MAG: hypothetical protein IT168_03390 [Bryobacterales bacterium]|nr:hypothetical protein [Bryobacterales bacterium]